MKEQRQEQRIQDLETALAKAEFKIERMAEELDYQPPIISSVEVKPVELVTFKQHCRAIEDNIEKSNYLSSGVNDALGELRFMVINCRTMGQSIDFEKQLMRSKANTTSDTYVGMLATDIAKKSVLGSKFANQLAVFNALFELDRVQEEMDITEFEDYLLTHDARSLLDSTSGKLADLVALRKAKINGSFEQIEKVIDRVLDDGSLDDE